jgi:hypothetical protein
VYISQPVPCQTVSQISAGKVEKVDCVTTVLKLFIFIILPISCFYSDLVFLIRVILSSTDDAFTALMS